MKEFDINLAKQGKPICTRDGKKARIICFDRKGKQQIIALVTQDNGEEFIENYHLSGRFNVDETFENNNDLMMLPEKKEGWINIYPNSYSNRERLAETGNIVYPTKESAIDNALHNCIATVPVEWEE